MWEITQFNIHTRTADDRFVSGARVLSMEDIIDATDVFCNFAAVFNTSRNSGSRVMLVW